MDDIPKIPLPDSCARGVPNSSYVGVSNGVEFPYPHSIYEQKRSHSSINWIDEEKAIIDLLDEKKIDGNGIESTKYESGYIRIPTKILYDLKRSSRLQGFHDFDFERNPLKTNQYHGNIIFKSNNDKRCKMLANAILAQSVFFCR